MGDIERTVRDGVPGTAMPAWGQFLADGEIGDVARYLVVFSPEFMRAWRKRELPPPLKISQYRLRLIGWLPILSEIRTHAAARP